MRSTAKVFFEASDSGATYRITRRCTGPGPRYVYCGFKWSWTQPRPVNGTYVIPLNPMQHNKDIIRRFIDVTLNRGDVEAAGQFVCEDVVEQVPFPGQGPGLEGLKDVLRGLREAFADLHWTVHEQIAEGDKVVTRFEWTGTHRGPFFGIPATGRPVRVWGMVIDRLDGGRIKETRILMDGLGLMGQLGLFPPPAGPA